MPIDYHAVAEMYRPTVIKTLLVGEAPPPSGSVYFYVPRNMPTNRPVEDDRNLPATIFNHYFGTRPSSIEEYIEFLCVLKANGIFLVDICEEPIKVRNSEVGLKRIINEIPGLTSRLAQRNIDVTQNSMVFLLARRDYESHIRKEFPHAKRFTWKKFRTNPETILLHTSNANKDLSEVAKLTNSCAQAECNDKTYRNSFTLAPEKPTYREATVADLLTICALGQVVNLLHHEALPHIFAPVPDLQRDKTYWRKGIDNVGATTFVAEIDGEIVGFVAVDVTTEKHTQLQPMCFARISSIYVVEFCRGHGIGRELMSLAEQWATANGAADIRLNVWAFNQSALRLLAVECWLANYH